MEPKFQSSFIPKGPVAASGNPAAVKSGGRSLIGLLATLIFTIALVLSIGVFGFNRFLSYRISRIGSELDAARAQVDASSVQELIRLNSRMLSIEKLLNSHVVNTPLFAFLEESTLRQVRFTELDYSASDKGLELRLSGHARSYATLALQAQAFSESPYFKDPVFSDLQLDEQGNVKFTFRASVDPSLVSYKRIVERESLLRSTTTTRPSAATSTRSSTATTSATGSTSLTASSTRTQ